MNLIQGIILGIVQGLSEFLPISSSGHLAVTERILGLPPSLNLIIFLHLATLLAVIIALWKDVIALIINFFEGLYLSFKNGFLKTYKDMNMFRLSLLIILGTIPAAVVGVLLENVVDKSFGQMTFVGIAFLITGTILFFADRARPLKNLNKMTTKAALWIGIAQSLAIFPGISRSGMTISAGLAQGYEKEESARFSFLLSIPIILGASLTKIGSISKNLTSVEIISFIFSLVSGYIAIKLLLYLALKKKLSYFSYYCWAIGILTLGFPGR